MKVFMYVAETKHTLSLMIVIDLIIDLLVYYDLYDITRQRCAFTERPSLAADTAPLDVRC